MRHQALENIFGGRGMVDDKRYKDSPRRRWTQNLAEWTGKLWKKLGRKEDDTENISEHWVWGYIPKRYTLMKMGNFFFLNDIFSRSIAAFFNSFVMFYFGGFYLLTPPLARPPPSPTRKPLYFVFLSDNVNVPVISVTRYLPLIVLLWHLIYRD